MRALSFTEVECIVNRVLARNDIYVMTFTQNGPIPAMMVINHGIRRASDV